MAFVAAQFCFFILHSSFLLFFTTDAEMVGRHGFAHLAVRQHFSPVKSRDFTVKVCTH
jgi:hypothetical protein